MPDPTAPLTLMAVHAHPDDEASSTGGILARYGAEGVRTVLVTCTRGELGDAPGGYKPGEAGHNEALVVAQLGAVTLAELIEMGAGKLQPSRQRIAANDRRAERAFFHIDANYGPRPA